MKQQTSIGTHTRFTAVTVLLILCAIISSALLLISKLYYWQLIDFFALPFFDTIDAGNIEIPVEVKIAYSELIPQLNTVKSHLFDYLIDTFGYDINAPFIAVFLLVSVTAVIYISINRNNRAAFTPLVICFLSGVIFASITPDVTVEQIRQAMFYTNDYDDPELNYLDLLRQHRYSELDEHLNNTEVSFSTGAIGEYQYVDEYKPLESATEKDLVYFDKWLAETSHKKIALIARGNLYEDLGWQARGEKFSNKTTDKEFSEMRKYFSQAVSDHQAVLAISEKSLLSHASLIRMAPAYDFGEDSEVVFERWITAFPTSYYLASHQMSKLQPKWGGSYRKIRALALKMRKKAVVNPMLISLGKYELTFRARKYRHDTDHPRYKQLKRYSMFYGVTVSDALSVALAYENAHNTKGAIDTLTQGLVFHRDDVELLANRANYYMIIDDVDSAERDIAKIVPEKIKNSWICYNAADVYKKLQQPEKSVPFYLRAIEIDPGEEYPYNRLYWLAYKEVIPYEYILPYMKKWTEVNPRNSDAWISYAASLREIDPESSLPAYKKFIEYANRNNSNDLNAIKYAEKLIKYYEEQ